jgi:hypothetical protein
MLYEDNHICTCQGEAKTTHLGGKDEDGH